MELPGSAACQLPRTLTSVYFDVVAVFTTAIASAQ